MTTRIDEGAFVDIHGVPQWLALRGDDRANPALMIVTGPGFGFAALAPFFSSFERSFTLVHWDQPGAGFTFGKNGEVGERTLERLVRDGLRVAELACARLGVSRAGHSVMFLRAEFLAALERHVRPVSCASADAAEGQA